VSPWRGACETDAPRHTHPRRGGRMPRDARRLLHTLLYLGVLVLPGCVVFTCSVP